AEWYSGIGPAGSKGTMIFSLVGKITNTGLVEVPFGITLREMIFNIGGGIPDGKKFKAIQTGGPSGGVIPEKYLDTPVDFDELAKLGSIMGSGGLIVMDEDTCMVDIARYFVNFLQGESCGKCTPCREGLTRMGQILDRITKGDGKIEDLQTLEDIADLLKNGALCALGSTAANPTMTTLQYFKDEYLVHIQNKKCPAGVCTALIEYGIDTEKCKACLRCIKECPTNAITGEKKKPESFTINQGLCIKCGSCTEVCKFHSIVKK
ncbi:MAG: 4Fe-4S binding protein, partial [Chloroflexi bacterium]|nr:4Fe-4S binding protein [Chloroflexota bacterium]